MAITPGTRLGAYEVLALLGSGGMGEVYRARDTRLDRVVAIKVLPASVAKDPDRRQRLDREARSVSSLNHPNICTLYDVGHQDGIDYLVMEFLEGQTLAERLTRGALPLDEAAQYAIQLADALDVAHRHGVVHRDVKPANVFLARRDSSATPITKLLDFGIAKAVALGPPAAIAGATLTSDGTLLGTLQYMAPEQLEGRDADTRSDLFAFGAVLYEMVTGRRAFQGESQASVIAAVLDSEPLPLSSSQPLTPPALEYLVKTCLAKNPDERWQAAGDVKRQLEWIAASGRSTPLPTAGRRSGYGVRVVGTVAVMTLVAFIAGGALTWYARTGLQEQAAPPHVTRSTIATSGTAALGLRPGRSLAITPDGTRVVYIGNDGSQLFVRPIDRFDSTAIFTAVGPLNDVFVSPDGQSAGFIEGGILKTIALTGGPAETIVEGGVGYGGAWAPDDTIIFSTGEGASGLQHVSAAGGDVTTLTRPVAARGELAHVWPAMLPGGRAVLFTITATTGGLDAAQVAALDLVTGGYKVLVHGGSDAHYVPAERSATKGTKPERAHLVYVKGATLMAIPFEPARLEASGTPVMVLPGLATTPRGSGVFDVADGGTIVYVDSPADHTAVARTLVWVDRQGLEKPLSTSLPPRPYGQPRLSPDGTRVAVAIDDDANDIWVWDVAGQTLRRLTSGPATDFFPVWTTDSQRLIFGRPFHGLFWQAADGSGNVEALSTNAGPAMMPTGMTPDGKRVLFTLGPPRDVMAMTLDHRRVEPLVQTPFNDRNGVVSPDGRWLAYESDSTQRFEIYVTPYPNVKGGTWPISTAGGTGPLWSPNSPELFFVAPDGAIMAASVNPRGGVWRPGAPVKVVDGQYLTRARTNGRHYDVSTDGKRFLIVKAPPSDQPAASQIQLVQHWAKELQRLVPATR